MQARAFVVAALANVSLAQPALAYTACVKGVNGPRDVIIDWRSHTLTVDGKAYHMDVAVDGATNNKSMVGNGITWRHIHVPLHRKLQHNELTLPGRPIEIYRGCRTYDEKI